MNKQEISEYFRKMGKKGGKNRAKNHSKEQIKKWSAVRHGDNSKKIYISGLDKAIIDTLE